jgi:hypothetical protein
MTVRASSSAVITFHQVTLAPTAHPLILNSHPQRSPSSSSTTLILIQSSTHTLIHSHPCPLQLAQPVLPPRPSCCTSAHRGSRRAHGALRCGLILNAHRHPHPQRSSSSTHPLTLPSSTAHPRQPARPVPHLRSPPATCCPAVADRSRRGSRSGHDALRCRLMRPLALFLVRSPLSGSSSPAAMATRRRRAPRPLSNPSCSPTRRAARGAATPPACQNTRSCLASAKILRARAERRPRHRLQAHDSTPGRLFLRCERLISMRGALL